jgi:hypothetical protein
MSWMDNYCKRTRDPIVHASVYIECGFYNGNELVWGVRPHSAMCFPAKQRLASYLQGMTVQSRGWTAGCLAYLKKNEGTMSEADDAVIKGAGLAGFTLALQLFVYLRQTQGWTEQQENELLDAALSGLENILPANDTVVRVARKIIGDIGNKHAPR